MNSWPAFAQLCAPFLLETLSPSTPRLHEPCVWPLLSSPEKTSFPQHSCPRRRGSHKHYTARGLLRWIRLVTLINFLNFSEPQTLCL